jgi:hypothetical protein
MGRGVATERKKRKQNRSRWTHDRSHLSQSVQSVVAPLVRWPLLRGKQSCTSHLPARSTAQHSLLAFLALPGPACLPVAHRLPVSQQAATAVCSLQSQSTVCSQLRSPFSVSVSVSVSAGA